MTEQPAARVISQGVSTIILSDSTVSKTVVFHEVKEGNAENVVHGIEEMRWGDLDDGRVRVALVSVKEETEMATSFHVKSECVIFIL